MFVDPPQWQSIRSQIIGADVSLPSPYGQVPLVYADWIASGRLYGPIEARLTHDFGPMVANTHSESSYLGAYMTHAYNQARSYIKTSLGTGPSTVLLPVGTGMTGAISKLQRILGLKVPEQYQAQLAPQASQRPVVFITHMEHHSNQTSWLETMADVEVIPPGPDLSVDPQALESLLVQYQDRSLKIGSFTAASNVTGLRVPYRQLASIMHRHGGLCFVDFAANAPYDNISMQAPDPLESLDAIFLAPHKFLGGPGSTGILAFNPKLYHNRIPDQPGGGTVRWTNPWEEHAYLDDIETREGGGTPGFLQTIRAALAFELKALMNIDHMTIVEEKLVGQAMDGLLQIPGVQVLAPKQRNRIGAISFYLDSVHYNLVVRLLSDRYGIQMRGGCSCAGTYGHYLLHVDQGTSRRISGKINSGDLSEKPGWVRWSIHPLTTTTEIDYILSAIEAIATNHRQWSVDYRFNKSTAEWEHLTWSAPIPRFF